MTILLFFPLKLASANPFSDMVETSTSPKALGDAFYRHLAFDFDMDIKNLSKFHKKGFGRAEIITLAIISKTIGEKINVLGRRRLKKNVTLKELAQEAGLDYVTLYKTVQIIKEGIEAKGTKNLPPPVYKEDEKETKKKKKPKKKKE